MFALPKQNYNSTSPSSTNNLGHKPNNSHNKYPHHHHQNIKTKPTPDLPAGPSFGAVAASTSCNISAITTRPNIVPHYHYSSSSSRGSNQYSRYLSKNSPFVIGTKYNDDDDDDDDFDFVGQDDSAGAFLTQSGKLQSMYQCAHQFNRRY